MEDTSSVVVSDESSIVRKGLINAVFNYDVFCVLLQHIADTHFGFHEFRPYMHVCYDFRSFLEKFAFRYICLDGPEYSTGGPCPQYAHPLERNKKIYRSCLQMLRDRSDIAHLVRFLGFCTEHTDTELVYMQYEIMRQCSSHPIHLGLKVQIYDAQIFRSVLSRVNPVSITFLGNTNPLEDGLNTLTWNLANIFLLVQGCSQLRHLNVALEIWRMVPNQNIREASNLELPIESLCFRNKHWYEPDLFTLVTVRLPNLKDFKAYVVTDDDSDAEINRRIFRRCITELWVKTLEELDLSIVRRLRPLRRPVGYNIFHRIPADKLPKLKKLHISADLLHPRSLVALSTLEHVCYVHARVSDLKKLALYLRESLANSRVPLPSLKRFELDLCTSNQKALVHLDYIRSVFDERKVTLWVSSYSSSRR